MTVIKLVENKRVFAPVVPTPIAEIQTIATNAAQPFVQQAETAAASAELSAAAAMAGAGKFFETTSEGIAETQEGQTFSVAGSGETFAQVYRHDAGGVATPIGEPYPSKSGAQDRANHTGTQGGDTVEFIQPSSGARALTATAKLAQRLSLNDFTGVDPTGVTPCDGAINAAIAAAAARKLPLHIDGHYRHNAQIVIPDGVFLIGAGDLPSYKTLKASSCFIKDFNGTGVVFAGIDTGTSGVQFDSIAGKTGDNVQVTGSRWRAPSIAVTNSGRDGLRIGNDGEAAINANCWFIGELRSYGAGRHGFTIDHTNAIIDANHPNGTPDANAGSLMFADIGECGQDGIAVLNTIDNYFGNVVAQHCGGYGIRLGSWARNNIFGKAYCEANTAGNGIIEANAAQNIIWASRSVTLSPGWTDNSANKSNMIFGHWSDIGEVGYQTTPWYWPNSLDVLAPAGVGNPAIRLWGTPNHVPLEIRLEADGATGTKCIIATRRTGVGLEDSLVIRQNGDVEVLRGKLLLGGKQLVSTRQAAIADVAVAASAPTKAEFDALVGAFNSLLSSLRPAGHGLIEA